MGTLRTESSGPAGSRSRAAFTADRNGAALHSPSRADAADSMAAGGTIDRIFDDRSADRGSTPRIRVSSSRPLFTTVTGDKAAPEEAELETDQNIDLTSLTPYSETLTSGRQMRGAEIRARGEGVTSSTQYPDGFRWTQTIETNVPLGGTSSPYVDPRPNDDTKPFYYTDSEHGQYAPNFYDRPRRSVPGSGTTRWFATLALNGVNGTNVTAFDAIRYGFEADSKGAVSLLGPQSSGFAAHQGVLASEFPGWTFG